MPPVSKPLQGILALAGGTAGGQALTVLVAPVLTRLFSPDSFGTFSYVLAVVTVIASVAALKLELAIPLARNDSDAQRLVRISLFSAAISAIVSAATVLLFPDSLARLLQFDLGPSVVWLAILILLTSWFVVMGQAALRQREYAAVAKRTLSQALGTAAGQLVAGTITPHATGLLAGQTFGRALGILALSRTNRDLLSRPRHGTYGAVLREYRAFPLVFAPSALLNATGSQLPVILITAWYGTEASGFLGIAQRVAMVPAAVIGTAVGQVFCGELSARLRSGNLDNRRLYLSSSLRLGAIGVLITLVLIALPPLVFPALFGTSWAQAGGFAQAMAPAIGLGFMVGPLSYVFIAYRRTAASLLVDASRIVLVGGLGLLALELQWEPTATLGAMYAGQLVNYVVTWTVGLSISTGKLRVREQSP